MFNSLNVQTVPHAVKFGMGFSSFTTLIFGSMGCGLRQVEKDL